MESKARTGTGLPLLNGARRPSMSPSLGAEGYLEEACWSCNLEADEDGGGSRFWLAGEPRYPALMGDATTAASCSLSVVEYDCVVGAEEMDQLAPKKFDVLEDVDDDDGPDEADVDEEAPRRHASCFGGLEDEDAASSCRGYCCCCCCACPRAGESVTEDDSELGWRPNVEACEGSEGSDVMWAIESSERETSKLDKLPLRLPDDDTCCWLVSPRLPPPPPTPPRPPPAPSDDDPVEEAALLRLPNAASKGPAAER